MQTFAVLDVETAEVLAAFLMKEGIGCESRLVEDENGLEAVELQVDDAQFDRACELAEQRQNAVTEEAAKKPKRRCPACASTHVDYIEDLDGVKTITQISAIYRCADCGHIVAAK